MPSYKFFLIIIMTISTSTSAWEEGFVYNDDVKIAYRDYGPIEGEPILLVQGLGGQLINWPDHLIDFLIKNGFRPIVFDNRDTGLSSIEAFGLFERFINNFLTSLVGPFNGLGVAVDDAIKVNVSILSG